MSTPIAAIIAILVVGGGLFAYDAWAEKQAAEAAAQRLLDREQEREETAEMLREQMAPLRRESHRLMPGPLQGVELGMPYEELSEGRALRAARDTDDPTMQFFEEILQNNAQVMYGIDRELQVLSQVQVLSRLPVEGVAPHLAAMSAEYGTPTGIWDCPSSGAAGVPTRRFTWRHSAVTIQDVFLVHSSGVSVTLYIAPTEIIGASLRISHCQPVRSADALETFPVASPDQMRDSVEETGRTVQL